MYTHAATIILLNLNRSVTCIHSWTVAAPTQNTQLNSSYTAASGFETTTRSTEGESFISRQALCLPIKRHEMAGIFAGNSFVSRANFKLHDVKTNLNFCRKASNAPTTVHGYVCGRKEEDISSYR